MRDASKLSAITEEVYQLLRTHEIDHEEAFLVAMALANTVLRHTKQMSAPMIAARNDFAKIVQQIHLRQAKPKSSTKH